MQTFSPENETLTTTTTLTINVNTGEGSEGTGVDEEHVLEALIWSCGFSKSRRLYKQWTDAGD